MNPAEAIAEMESLIDRSFLSRVPSLMASGISYEESLKQALKDDEELMYGLQDTHQYDPARFSRTLPNYPLAAARKKICTNVYQELKRGELA